MQTTQKEGMGMMLSGPTRLRCVMWQNIWNWTLEESGTTRAHFTAMEGRAGKTLCGRPFPIEKGYPVAVRFCKRCLTKAKAMGYSVEQLRKLAHVH